MRPGPITSQCSPHEGPESSGFVVRAWLPPVKGFSKAMVNLDEEFSSEAEAREFFQKALNEDGLNLHCLGWGEIFRQDRNGERHVEWQALLSADQIQKALEAVLAS